MNEAKPEPVPAVPRPETVKQGSSKLQEKFDAQKKALQRLTLSTLEFGAQSGLTPEQVRALRDAFEVLGWLPTDVRV